MGKTFKDKVAASGATLFVSIIYAVITWILTGLRDPLNWAGFGAMLLITAVLRRMSNGNALMRMRTWIVPSTYICLCAAFTFEHNFSFLQISVLLYAAALYFLFQSYQKYHAERWVFQAFFFLSCASLGFPPLIWLALTFYFAMIVQLRVFFVRTIMAGIFGLIMPLQIFAGLSFYFDRIDRVYGYINQIISFNPVKIRLWEISPTVSIGFVFILFLFGAFHYARTNFNDKIKTRIFFYILITQSLLLFLSLLLQPQLYESLSRFILLTISPVAGHYFAFSRGKIVQLLFALFLLAMLAITGFNLWQSSLLSF